MDECVHTYKAMLSLHAYTFCDGLCECIVLQFTYMYTHTCFCFVAMHTHFVTDKVRVLLSMHVCIHDDCVHAYMMTVYMHT
jgi:hypothetical protein